MINSEWDEVSTTIIKSLCTDIPSGCYNMLFWKMLKRELGYQNDKEKEATHEVMHYVSQDIGETSRKILKRWSYEKGGN